MVGIMLNTHFFQITYFEKCSNMAVAKGLRETISVCKKTIFSSCHMEEKTFIEASHTFKIHTAENVFATATLKDL